MQSLLIHPDLSRRAVVDGSALDWHDSPMPGVQRRMLERDGGEQARATSIVRYAPGSRFSPHTHERGEELFVLDGVLEDEFGHYGPGSYIKNPPGSAHTPASVTGCLLWVKLRHLAPDDSERVVVNTQAAAWQPGLVPGLAVMSLSSHATQHTALVRWAPGTRFRRHQHWGGEEIYVLSGVFEDEHGRYPAGHWLRSPHLSQHTPFSGEGCTILVKTGHLQ